MAIDLLGLEPQKISKNLRGKSMLFYGSAGVGKTTLASKFGKVLICGFERGYSALNNAYVQPIKTWSDWKQVVSQLTRKDELKEKFDMVAIDTADEAFKLCEKFVCTQAGVESIKDVAAFGGGYKILDDAFMTPFRDLSFAGYGIIFISHDTEKPYRDDNGEEYNKIVPALPNRPFNLINKMVDIVGYIRQISIPTENGYEDHRYVFFRSDNRFLTKSRFKYIAPRVELDYNQIVNAIYDSIDEEVKNSGGDATDEIDSYLVRDFEELMTEAKELWGQVVSTGKVPEAQKILENEFGKPTKFSEILPEQTEQLQKILFEIKGIL